MGAILDRIASEKNSNLPVSISLITGAPSCALYTLVVFTMGRHWKKFDSSFWRLFFLRGLLHIYDFLNSAIFIRIGQVPLGHSLVQQFPSPLLAFGYFAWLYNYESQNYASIFLLLTRLTSVLYPVKHKKIWRRLLPFCICVTFLVPLFDTWQNLARKYSLDYDESNILFENNTFTINYDATVYTTYEELNAYYTADNWVAIRSSVILLAVCTLLNVATIFFYAKQPKNGGAAAGGASTMSAEEQSVERRLLIFSVLNFLCQLLMALWWIITSVCYDRYYICGLLKNNQYWIKDIDALHSPPWLILWSSKLLREMVCKQLGLAKWLESKNSSNAAAPTTVVFSTPSTMNQKKTKKLAWTK